VTDLDLDALERVVADAKAQNFGSLAFSMDTKVIDAVIQRLREAEVERDHMLETAAGEIAAKWHVQFQPIQAELELARKRIVQLERVRDAVPQLLQLVSESHRDGPWFAEPKQPLDAHAIIVEVVSALAAVEEKK